MYCTAIDVQGLIKNFEITDTSTVTLDELNNEIIPEVCRQIDDRLGNYYVTPITGADALITINLIAKRLSAAEVMGRVFLGMGTSDSPQALTWQKQADADITRIIKGDITLRDALPTDDTPVPMSRQVSSRLSNPAYSTPPLFSIGKKF